MPATLKITLPEQPSRSYDIVLSDRFDSVAVGGGQGQVPGLAGTLSKWKFSSIIVITEERLRDLVYGHLKPHLEVAAAGRPIHVVYRPGGEESKHSSFLEPIYDELIRSGVDRSTLLFAVGGGVVGDFAGYLAATLLRGIPLVQIPSTLLSMIDSSVGGKVAVNVNAGKNMVGAFYQPRLVFANLSLLQTLPDEEWLCGLAEMAKHAMLAEEAYVFDRLLASAKKGFRSLSYEELRDRIAESIAVKARVVMLDERETGLRACLNLGHTTAHAIESLLQYRGMTHGEAVSRGLVAALLLSREMGGLPAEECESMLSLMEALALPMDTAGFEADALIEHMQFDKKNEGGTVRFVLLERRGQPVWGIPLEADAFRRVWSEQRNRFG